MSSVEMDEPPRDGVTLVGQTDTTGPLGEAEAARDTADEKPALLATVTVEEAEDPASVRETVDGLAEMAKSEIWSVKLAVWLIIASFAGRVPVKVDADGQLVEADRLILKPAPEPDMGGSEVRSVGLGIELVTQLGRPVIETVIPPV